MNNDNKFIPPINGECICEYTISQKISTNLNQIGNSAFFMGISFLIISSIKEGILYFIPIANSWESAMNIIILILWLVFILWFFPHSEERENKKFIYYTSNGLTYNIDSVRYNTNSYIENGYRNKNLISFKYIFGLRDSKIIFNEKTYKVKTKYKNNIELLVEFLNDKQQEWEDLRLKEREDLILKEEMDVLKNKYNL
jgi:hypothetical protein